MRCDAAILFPGHHPFLSILCHLQLWQDRPYRTLRPASFDVTDTFHVPTLVSALTSASDYAMRYDALFNLSQLLFGLTYGYWPQTFRFIHSVGPHQPKVQFPKDISTLEAVHR